jgi:NAD+ diphosphatase
MACAYHACAPDTPQKSVAGVAARRGSGLLRQCRIECAGIPGHGRAQRQAGTIGAGGMKDPEAVTFGGATLDRAAHLRGDDDAIAAMRAQPEARWVPFLGPKPLLDVREGALRLGWLPLSSPVFATEGSAIFLGLDAGAPRFARQIADWEPEPDGPAGFVDTSRRRHPELSENLEFADLRATMGELAAADAGNGAVARGLFAWHETHRFCARCGQPSEIDLAGWRRTCPACGASHFPRTDPVVIMLVTYGNAVLLGRSPGWPEGMYSLLAGFMEPGETVEAAVRRETFEETGIRLGAVSYLSSQPWPFPSSLMIGCRAEALDPAIRLDPAELEDAVWVTKEAALEALTGTTPGLRPARKGAIARFLIERWLADRLE